ncbi:tetratricopeptide repeat protein [Nocardiopsis sp. NPDC050513]|uniref:tetratricopeptide repeat protein n=1 Tax=Nocardiopsis sp. NPDC050513 TaxID=3364338 RepID=UPI003791CF47
MSGHQGMNHFDFRKARAGTIIGQQINHHHAKHEVHWPVHVGAIPEEAAHYQRRTVASHLDEALSSFGIVVPLQVLSGTGGVGKTQLAANYARNLRKTTGPEHRIDLLIWADASTRDQITYAYAQAAHHLLAIVPEDPEDAAHLFLAWLQDSTKHRGRRWLIVWDDLADPANVDDLWPPHDQPRGRMLVTTRRRDHTLTVQGRHLLDVDVFTEEEARVFLVQALDAAGIDDTREELDILARDLGYLPLALGQAVPYMAELGLGCRGYLQVFHDRMSALREVFPDWTRPTPLTATWDLSLAQADTFHPRGTARPLMGIIALLDGTAIPEQVLTAPPVLEYLAAHRTCGQATLAAPDGLSPRAQRGPGFLARLRGALGLSPAASDTKLGPRALASHEVRAALAALARLNLTTRTTTPPAAQEDTPGPAVVGAHQLVQRATREHTATRPTQTSVRTVADALVNVWPEIERDTALAQLLRANTTVLCSHPISGGQCVEDWLWDPDGHDLLLRSSLSLGEAGRVSEAIASFQHLTESAHKHLGPDHPDTLTFRGGLARWRGEAGDTAGAATAFETLLDDHLRILGPDHPDTLTFRGGLARWRGEAGDAAGAATAFETLLAETLRVQDADHPAIFMIRHHLARWRGEAGDAGGAVTAYEGLLDDQLRILGPDHPDTLATRNNLARIQGQAGNPVGAATAYENLYAEMLRVLGPDHPDTLATRSSVARWRGEAGDAAGAATVLDGLLTDQVRVLGSDHPHTLNTRSSVARWRGEAGDAGGAIAAYEGLLTDIVRVLGTDHPLTLTTRSGLAHMKGQAGDPAGAATDYEGVLTDMTRVLGPHHPDTLTNRNNLAHMRGQAGDPAGAATDYEGLLTDQLRILGADHPNTLASRSNLAHWRSQDGDGRGAAAAYEGLLTDIVRVLGTDHPLTLTTRSGLAHMKGQAGDPAGAATDYEGVLTDMTRVLGPHHPNMLATRSSLARWRGKAGDAPGAATAYAGLLTEVRRVLGPDHPDTLTTRHNLTWWTYQSGDIAKAIELLSALGRDQQRVLGPDHPHTLNTRNNLAAWTYRSGDTVKAAEVLSTLADEQERVLGPDHPDTQASKEVLRLWRDELSDK